MTNVLQHIHEKILTVYDIMLSLKELFGDQGHAIRQEAMWALLNTNMVEGTPV